MCVGIVNCQYYESNKEREVEKKWKEYTRVHGVRKGRGDKKIIIQPPR